MRHLKMIAILGLTLKGATVKGVNFTKQENAVGENIVEPGQLGSDVQVLMDTYEASALADGSVIKIGKALPAGARIVDAAIHCDALGGSTTLALGDSNDPDRYIDAASTASAATLRMSANPDGINYEIGTNDGDEEILVTLAGAAATGTIKVVVLYSFA